MRVGTQKRILMRGPSIFFLSLPFLLSACIKEELPVPAVPRGDAVTTELCMGPGYQDQIWFDLSTASTVHRNAKTAWDLAFESAPDGWHVLLNGARLMTAWNIGVVDLTAAHDTVGMQLGRRIDAPSGDADSTAFGDWRGTDAVYIVDLGYDLTGLYLGQRKVRFASVDAASFTIETTQLDGSDLRSIVIPKDGSRTYTYFSFAGGVVVVEPVRGSWDLVITQYSHQFYTPYIPYIVAGVLIDGTATRAARIVGRDFTSISLSDTLNFPFEERRNVIGYDWKVYSFETSSYSIDPTLAYIVRDSDGYYFKLRFLEFYGDLGQTGCPLFETVPL